MENHVAVLAQQVCTGGFRTVWIVLLGSASRHGVSLKQAANKKGLPFCTAAEYA